MTDPKIKVIPKEEIERRKVIEKRAEISMLKILLERHFPDKVKIVFPNIEKVKLSLC